MCPIDQAQDVMKQASHQVYCMAQGIRPFDQDELWELHNDLSEAAEMLADHKFGELLGTQLELESHQDMQRLLHNEVCW